MAVLRVAAVQHDIVWNDPAANRAALDTPIAAAAAHGARLVLLAETFSTGFGFTDPNLTVEAPGGPTTTWMSQQAVAHNIWLGGTLAERADGDEKPANTFVLAGPDGTEHRYRKIHPFSHSGEHEHVTAGTEHVTATIDGVRCTLFICYDLRFADEFWQCAADTDCYLVPANWPASRRDHWTTLLRARAIENQAYVVGINRVGSGDGLDYSGDSRIIDPSGSELVTASNVPTTLYADIDTDHVVAIRDRFRFLQDRR